MALVPIMWDFSKNKFVKMAGGGGGSGITAEEMSNPVADPDASSGTAVSVKSTGGTTIIVDTNIEGSEFGMLGINLRLKTTNNTYSSAALLIRTFFKQNASTSSRLLLTTTYLKGTDFIAANKYQNIGIICNYYGNTSADPADRTLEVEVATVAGYSATVNFDYVKVQPVFPGVYAMPTVQS